MVEALTGGTPPRVWSLLVTVFGDLAQDLGAEISGPTLTRLTDAIGIKPEAARVALHRLRKEGWIDTRRVGRHSAYRLTEWGRAQSAAASPRIYGREEAAKTACLIVPAPSAGADAPIANAVPLGQGLWLAAETPAGSTALACPLTVDADLPDWIGARVAPASLCDLATLTVRRLQACETLLNETSQLPALQAAVLRVLIVHGWRRVALRSPVLPDYMFPKAWDGAACRRLASDLLQILPRPSLDALDSTDLRRS